MSFPYNLNIPAAGNNPSNDQPLMQTNTNSINSIIGVDHYNFSSSNSGRHTQVQLPVLGTIPAGLISGEGTLYTKTSGSESTLFYSPDLSGNEYQMTRTIAASGAQFGTNNAYGTPPLGWTQVGGWTFLPGGMLFQYGLFSNSGALGASGTIQFPVTFTNPPYSVVAILVRSASASQFMSLPGTVTTSSFNFQCSSASSDGVYWTAIGK